MKSIHKISIISLIHISALYSLTCGILAGFIILALLAGLLAYRFQKADGFKPKTDHWFGILGIGCGLLAYAGIHPLVSFIGLYGFGVFAGLLITNIWSRKYRG